MKLQKYHKAKKYKSRCLKYQFFTLSETYIINSNSVRMTIVQYNNLYY